MTATNHALTGAIIGLTVSNPVLAVPSALLSHLLMDAIPHFGSPKKWNWPQSRSFVIYLLAEAALCGLLVLSLLLSRPANWPLSAICAFVAASPDFLSIRLFKSVRAGKKFHPNHLENFLKKIQWFEQPIGAVVEACWLAACLLVLSLFI